MPIRVMAMTLPMTIPAIAPPLNPCLEEVGTAEIVTRVEVEAEVTELMEEAEEDWVEMVSEPPSLVVMLSSTDTL
jgi:hypothetical protein